MDMNSCRLKELMAWDLFKWIVVALLAAQFLFIGGIYSHIRSDIAELKQDVTTYPQEITDSDPQLQTHELPLARTLRTPRPDSRRPSLK